MAQEQKNDDGPPLGSAPGYGDLSEGAVGNQGTAEPQQPQPPPPQPQGPGATSEQGQASGAEDTQSQQGGDVNEGRAHPPNTPLFKEELSPEEEGTSLDEGGAG